MPCSRSRKKVGERCDFQLRAERPDLNCGIIHVYAHSQHNHPLESEGKVKVALFEHLKFA
jgi:hypothetical protein